MLDTLRAVGCWLVLVLPCIAVESAADAPGAFAERTLGLCDTILSKHILPPTRQQMLLAGAREVYRALGRELDPGLARTVSDLATDEAARRFLMQLAATSAPGADVEEPFLRGLFETLPGGAHRIKAKDAAIQEQLAANRYVGIGIALGMRDGPFISRVIYGGPAAKAGLTADDRIRTIDGVATQGMAMKEVLDRLRGRRGSKLKLEVQQPKQAARQVDLVRDVTFIPTIEGHTQQGEGRWQHLVDDTDVALIRITQIGPSTLHEIRQIETALQDTALEGIVLDLRTGGGLLHDTLLLADQLMDGGTIGHVQSVEGTVKHEASPGCLFQDVPMVVLIGGQANADRVFLAAALQDSGRARVVGQPTQGETYVRSLLELPSGDRLRMAVGLLQRASGTTLLRRPGQAPFTALGALPTGPVPSKQVLKHKAPYIIPDDLVRGRGSARVGSRRSRDPVLDQALRVFAKGRPDSDGNS